MRVDPDRAALVVVDMQNGFCRPDGSLYAPGSEAAIEPVADLVDRAREAGVQVVYTRDVHPPEQFEDAHYYDEFDRWGDHVVEGTWETEIVADLDVREADHVVEKHTYDAFHETELDGWLTARGIDDLVICGTLANVCVLHTADHADFLFGEVVDGDDLAFVQP
ncbi:cysteine hydrolase [Halobacteriales archaeon SW_12_71_31]|nr:MAG: cysteine hydrolase [Halobacteriales archaeon SW_12_71_31]